MSVNTAESENAQPVAHKPASELIYRLEDRPPLPQTLFAAFQHLLAMFVAVITPALLICRALGLPAQDTQHIISMSLFASGVASIIQIKASGPGRLRTALHPGHQLQLCRPADHGRYRLENRRRRRPHHDGRPLRHPDAGQLHRNGPLPDPAPARRIITPLVSGVVVMIIGLSLIQVGLTSIGGGYAAMADHTFGAPKNLLLAGIVLALIIILNRQRNPYLRIASLVIAMAAGYLAAWFLDMLPANTAPTNSSLITVPTPLYYGLGIDWSLLLPLMLVFMITSLETIGDITATSDVSEQPVSGPLYMKRLKGGVLANGLNSFVSAVFNTFPNSCFGQNNGVIQLTGVASRYVGFVVALMLIVLGLFPAVSGFVQHIPEPVLGGATLVMFGTIAASGVRIVSREPLNRRAILIIALSLAVGLGVSQQPLILQFAPDWLKNLLSSGIAAGGITAIVLNLIFPPEKA